MLGAKTLELAHDGKSLLLQLDAEAARDQWVRAIDGALARFRRTATARPEPRKEVTEVENRKGWDAGIEERARLEVDARRAAVRAAGLALQEADRRLDAARAEHLHDAAALSSALREVLEAELRLVQVLEPDFDPGQVAHLAEEPAAPPAR